MLYCNNSLKVKVLVAQSCLTLCNPMDCIAHWAPLSMEFSWQEYWSGLPCPSPEDLPNPGIEPRSPTLQADSLPAEPPGKPKNTGVGSLSLLQIQESNQSLLHCRWIPYYQSHQGSPRILEWVAYPFSKGTSWPRNWTGVSYIAGRFSTSWVTREAQSHHISAELTNLGPEEAG